MSLFFHRSHRDQSRSIAARSTSTCRASPSAGDAAIPRPVILESDCLHLSNARFSDGVVDDDAWADELAMV